ncbi:hypothetical protein JCM10908_003039 [Rhodotorula pacifica]|uniref:uncharacterized protein n=1 Tax=Rhodotorula pacifica TaxID=1495444 RepID=UPI00317B9148
MPSNAVLGDMPCDAEAPVFIAFQPSPETKAPDSSDHPSYNQPKPYNRYTPGNGIWTVSLDLPFNADNRFRRLVRDFHLEPVMIEDGVIGVERVTRSQQRSYKRTLFQLASTSPQHVYARQYDPQLSKVAAQTYLCYGIPVTNESLTYASHAYDKLDGPFRFIQLVQKRIREGRLQAQGNRAVTYLPAEIWDLVRHKIVDLELRKAERNSPIADINSKDHPSYKEPPVDQSDQYRNDGICNISLELPPRADERFRRLLHDLHHQPLQVDDGTLGLARATESTRKRSYKKISTGEAKPRWQLFTTVVCDW